MDQSSPPPTNSLLHKIKKLLIGSFLGRYLGLGLPKRDHKFFLVAQFASSKADCETNVTVLWDRWELLQDKPAALLDDVANHLEQLNKNITLPPGGFNALLEFIAGYIFPIIEDYFYRFRRNGGIPDSAAKTMMIEGAIRILQLLIRGTAIQFQADYLLPNHQLVKVMSRLGSSLLRLLELTWLLQNLHMIRYKLMPRDHLVMIGKAYAAHLPFGDVTFKRELLSKTNLSLSLDTDSTKGAGRARASLQEMFTIITLAGFLDTTVWHTEHLYMPTAVLASLDNPPLLQVYEGESLQENQWIYSVAQGEFVLPEKVPAATAAFSLDTTSLREHLDKLLPASLANLSASSADPLFAQAPFTTLNAYDLWLALSLLNTGFFQSAPQPQPSDRVEHKPELHVILGYATCFSLIFDKNSMPLAKFIEKNSMILSLSQGSSILVGNQEEEKGTEKKKQDSEAEKNKVDRNIWQINLDTKSDQTITLNTTESDRSRPMRIGQVLMFLYKTETDWLQGEIGFIHRLVRGSEGRIYIGIYRFTKNHQSVILKRASKGDAALNAMLVRDIDKKEYLLFPHHPLFRQGCAIEVTAPNAPPRSGVLGTPAFPGLECQAHQVNW